MGAPFEITIIFKFANHYTNCKTLNLNRLHFLTNKAMIFLPKVLMHKAEHG